MQRSVEADSLPKQLIGISEKILRSGGFMVAHANDELSWAGSIDGGHSTLRIAAHVSNLSLRRLCVSEAQVGVEDPDIAAYIRVSRTLSSDKVQELNDDPFANYIFEAFAAHPVNKSRLHLF